MILCSRSVKAGESAIADEIAKLGHGGYIVDTSNVVVKQLDLVSLQSIKSFADDILLSETRIDLVVLNAGIMALPKLERTDSGFEKQIGVNHFVCVLSCLSLYWIYYLYQCSGPLLSYPFIVGQAMSAVQYSCSYSL